jgi:hypothetical protein
MLPIKEGITPSPIDILKANSQVLNIIHYGTFHTISTAVAATEMQQIGQEIQSLREIPDTTRRTQLLVGTWHGTAILPETYQAPIAARVMILNKLIQQELDGLPEEVKGEDQLVGFNKGLADMNSLLHAQADLTASVDLINDPSGYGDLSRDDMIRLAAYHVETHLTSFAALPVFQSEPVLLAEPASELETSQLSLVVFNQPEYGLHLAEHEIEPLRSQLQVAVPAFAESTWNGIRQIHQNLHDQAAQITGIDSTVFQSALKKPDSTDIT